MKSDFSTVSFVVYAYYIFFKNFFIIKKNFVLVKMFSYVFFLFKMFYSFILPLWILILWIYFCLLCEEGIYILILYYMAG